MATTQRKCDAATSCAVSMGPAGLSRCERNTSTPPTGSVSPIAVQPVMRGWVALASALNVIA
jgi:hypothetical protein